MNMTAQHSVQTTLVTLLLACACALALGYMIFLVVTPGAAFVHPDFHDNTLQEAVLNGLSFQWSDFLMSLQPRAPGEFRPRFLAYWLMAIDQKTRLALY